MAINWTNIRPLNGSQADGFEELCAQLARRESPDGAKFVRKGIPDAGVECYCILDDGSEWGWQAKYFKNIQPSQWPQLDLSVKKAFDKHPKLARYFICIPIDRPDPRIPGQKSTMQRWNEHVEKWQGWAQERKMCVQFVWWGNSEMLELLSRSDHIGRVYFWFGHRAFDSDWFRERLTEAVRSAGPRYSPEVHIDLPIARELEIFGRSEFVFEEIKSTAIAIRRRLNNLLRSYGTGNDPSGVVSIKTLSDLIDEVLQAIVQIDSTPIGNLPFADIAEKIELVQEEVDRFKESLLQHRRDRSGDKTDNDESYHESDFLPRSLYQLQDEIKEAHSALKHADSYASSQLMLLKGEAGTGKTHLLCDFARRRIESGAPTILLMGQRFVSKGTPWIQVLQQLDLQGVRVEEFVGALEAAAQAAESRALVIVDALNEGEGRSIWPNDLAAFLTSFENSPWIAVLLSVRTEYEEFIIPEEVRTRGVSLIHHGFGDVEYEATQTFFSYYGIEFPSTPILQPEFRNPLFLKTVCRGLNETGQRRLPRGFQGITAVFDLFLSAINKRLANSLGFNPNDDLVRQALEKLAAQLTTTERRWLDRRNAEAIVNELLPNREFERSLYRNLVTEGILTESMNWQSSGLDSEIVYISYDRFADHVIADSLLRVYRDENALRQAFEDGGPLSFICDSDKYVPPGLIEALCVQIPEKFGQELVEVVPLPLCRTDVSDAIWQSVIWRRTDAFSEKTRKILNRLFEVSDDYFDGVEALLTVSTLEDHPFNAETLDNRLRRDSMPDRDAWWSTLLHQIWDESSAVKRLLDWSTSVREDSDLEDKTVELCTITLGWMLTTSQRFLRDRVTKALVSLLTGRFDATTRFVSRFSDVNDPYVTERIYAVAYGVVMRSDDATKVSKLASLVYEQAFANGTPPVHILLRDYARGVVERAIHLNPELDDINEDLVRPPYKSTWPTIPTEEGTRSIGNGGESDVAKRHIEWSVTSGDFAQYVIGTNSNLTNWLSLRLGEDPWRSSDARMEALFSKFNEHERKAWKEYKAAKDALRDGRSKNVRVLLKTNTEKTAGNAVEFESLHSEKDLSNLSMAKENALKDLRAVLSRRNLIEFNSILEDEGKRAPRFQLELIQRYVLWRVFDLGWTVERFGKFDRSVRQFGREASKAERIGKKYQWIAFHEILAYISDHYQYREMFHEDEVDQAYEGPWQEWLRDIDPSCMLQSTPGGNNWGSHTPSWWAPSLYDKWDEHVNHQDWIIRKDDFPNMEDLLCITHPSEGTRWINLNGDYVWRQPCPADQEPFDLNQRELWLICTGFFVRSEHADVFMGWAKDESFVGSWMPEPPGSYKIFLGEYGWAQAFKSSIRPYLGCANWMKPERACPTSVRPAAWCYTREYTGFDCSVEDSYSLHLPGHNIVENLDLKWAGHASDYKYSDGRLAALDPTAHEDGPSALLLREELLRQYLANEDLTLCWTVVGEKRVLRKETSGEYHGRMEISGAYVYKDESLEGFLKSNHDALHSSSNR